MLPVSQSQYDSQFSIFNIFFQITPCHTETSLMKQIFVKQIDIIGIIYYSLSSLKWLQRFLPSLIVQYFSVNSQWMPWVYKKLFPVQNVHWNDTKNFHYLVNCYGFFNSLICETMEVYSISLFSVQFTPDSSHLSVM